MGLQLHRRLPASWWLDESRVAGCARPGFGALPWRELTPQQAALLTWLGSRPGSSASLAELPAFLDEYVELRQSFFGSGTAALRACLGSMLEGEGLQRSLDELADRSGVRGNMAGDRVEIEVARVADESALLREAGIEVLVSLMEREPDPAVADSGLEVHHLALADMLPPRREQVEELAGLLEACEAAGRAVVVHCLAGIGRTTTMLASARLLQGAGLAELSERLLAANPSFRQQGPQWDFLERLAAERD